MTENGGIKDQKIKELEVEIARLKGEVVVIEEMYKGNPVLSFSGQFRPFSLGLNKCKAILKSIDKIEAFIKKYEKNL